MKKLITNIFSLILISTLFISVASAQTTVGGGGGTTVGGGPTSGNIIHLDNPFKTGGNLIEFITVIINNIILPIGGVLAVLAFIFSGFKYVTAQGDPSKIKEAHRALLYTVIGTAILLGAWLIAGVISNTIDKLKTG